MRGLCCLCVQRGALWRGRRMWWGVLLPALLPPGEAAAAAMGWSGTPMCSQLPRCLCRPKPCLP